MPMYEEAWFVDESGQWTVASYRELRNDEKRAFLRTQVLTDVRQGQLLLGVRNHPKTPHFYRKGAIRENIEGIVRESEQHNKTQNILLSFLKKKSKVDFGYYERPWDAADRGFESLIRIQDYQWDSEVKFGLIYGKFIVFDLLGRSSQISLVDNHPYIAIEVVDTHFHSIESFHTLLALTRNLPIIVCYYFVNKAPVINQMKNPSREGAYARIRLQHYLADGSFWKRNERIEETLENIDPNEWQVYYKFIVDFLNNKELIRRQA